MFYSDPNREHSTDRFGKLLTRYLAVNAIIVSGTKDINAQSERNRNRAADVTRLPIAARTRNGDKNLTATVNSGALLLF